MFCGFYCLLAIGHALERVGGVDDLQMMSKEGADGWCGYAAAEQN